MRGSGVNGLSQRTGTSNPEKTTDVERQRHVVIAHLAGNRRQRFQIGEQIPDVFDFRMLVGRVGKRREIMRALGRGPLQHRGDEISFGPAADAVSRIGRDVGHVKGPERRSDRKPAAEPEAIGLARHRVAGGTSTGIERCEPVGKIRRPWWKCARRDDGWTGQPPEKSEAGYSGQHRSKENSSQHSPTRHQASRQLV